MRLFQLVTITLFALAIVPGGAHLLEITTKMSLDRESYMTVQQIYRGWNLMGIAKIVALGCITGSALAWKERSG